MLFLVNPVSGKRTIIRYLPQVIRTFMDGGYLVTTAITSRRGEATEIAAALGKEYDAVCCAGGDGTLNEILTGLAGSESFVPVGYIPCGSTNDFAACHNLSTDILTAARNIVSGRSTFYDIGTFGGQYFSYVAAFGAFSWLSYTTDQNLKNALGHTAYILDGIKDLSKIKPYAMKITANGIVHEGTYIFGAVSNSTSIAGTIRLPESTVDTCDGVFECLLIRMPETVMDLDWIVRSLVQQEYNCPFLDVFQASEFQVENPEKTIWALDGESSEPYAQCTIRTMPRCFQLLG
jgi:YegS/Rv2252/BmrU family lipid kinase